MRETLNKKRPIYFMNYFMKELHAAAKSELPCYDGCMQILVIATHFFCHNSVCVQVLPDINPE